MLNNDQIVRCLREVAITMKHEFSTDDIHHVEANQRTYSETDLVEFKRDLVEAGNKIRVLFMEYHLDDTSFQEFFANQNTPVLAFIQRDGIKPVLLSVNKKKNLCNIL